MAGKTVIINKDAHVYGKGNERVTGEYTCDEVEAKRLVETLEVAVYKEENREDKQKKSKAELMEIADKLGINYPKNISVSKLEEKIAAKEAEISN